MCVYVCVCVEINRQRERDKGEGREREREWDYFKELAFWIMEADKSKICKVCHKDTSQHILEFKSKGSLLAEFLLALGRSVFYCVQPLIDWMRPIHIMKSNLWRSPEEGNGNPFQYSCLDNSMGRGVQWATDYVFAELDMTEGLTHTALLKVHWCKS